MKKATLYLTNNYEFFGKSEITPACGKLEAPLEVITGEPISRGFTGFGVALTGSSCYNLSRMTQAERDAFLTDIYSKDGLNLSVARLTVGVSDYSKDIYTYDDMPAGETDEELKHFSIDRDREYVLPMVKQVAKLRPDMTFFSSPWTPPAWMKCGGSVSGGYMRKKYIETYARYYAKYLKAYKSEGIDIYALTPQNEPEVHHKGVSIACVWSHDDEAEFVLALKPILEKEKLDTKIWLYDHSFNGYKRVLWQFEEYPELRSAADGVAFHYYDSAMQAIKPLTDKFPELPVHFTEGGPRLYDNYSTDWCKWAKMIALALNGGCKSFTGWNLLLDETGGPNVGPFSCGGLATLNRETHELSYSGQYRAFKHFAPFIAPESSVLKTEILDNFRGMFAYPDTTPLLTASAVKNPDGSKVYFLVNPAQTKKQVQLNVDGTYYYVELLPDTLATVVLE